jgi:hypothetical protein
MGSAMGSSQLKFRLHSRPKKQETDGFANGDVGNINLIELITVGYVRDYSSLFRP